MNLDTVFAFLGIIFGCLLVIMTLGGLCGIVAAKIADRELEEIERKVRERKMKK